MMDKRMLVETITKKLVDEGKLVEAGWASLRVLTLPPDTPADQLREMRMAFFAGAQHLFGSIMGMMDDGEEPTAADMSRMDMIHKELQGFIAEMQARLAREQH